MFEKGTEYFGDELAPGKILKQVSSEGCILLPYSLQFTSAKVVESMSYLVITLSGRKLVEKKGSRERERNHS